MPAFGLRALIRRLGVGSLLCGQKGLRAASILGAMKLLFVVSILVCFRAQGQPAGANYDEAKVPKYTLPDPLVTADGTPVKDAALWRKKRRPEILGLFAEQVYGRTPSTKVKLRTEVLEIDKAAHGGLATRKQVRVWFGQAADAPFMDLLMYLPNTLKGKAPAFLGLNFGGNHTVQADPEIRVTKSWVRENDHVASEKSRGTGASRCRRQGRPRPGGSSRWSRG